MKINCGIYGINACIDIRYLNKYMKYVLCTNSLVFNDVYLVPETEMKKVKFGKLVINAIVILIFLC